MSSEGSLVRLTQGVSLSFDDLALSQTGVEYPTFHMRGEHSNHCTTALYVKKPLNFPKYLMHWVEN